MKIEWSYFWRNLGFHFMWYLLSPLTVFISSIRLGGLKAALHRRKLVYESLMVKFVLRPSSKNLLDEFDADEVESVVWLSNNYKLTMPEAAQVFKDHNRQLAASINYLTIRKIVTKK